MRRNHRQTQDLWKGMLAGMAGGLVASWAMNQFQAGVKKISEASQQGQASEQGQNGGQAEEAEDATMKTAEKVSEVVAHRSLPKEQKKQEKQAGPVVHYAFGTLVGAAYGTASELDPRVRYGAGVPFGTALWIGADEVAVPALGLAGSPKNQPVSSHAQYFAAHVVYGLTTEMVRRAVRAAL